MNDDIKLFELDEEFVSSAYIKGETATIQFNINKIKNGSRFSIGEKRKTTFSTDQHFNWLQKLMWKWCFGVKVEDYNEE